MKTTDSTIVKSKTPKKESKLWALVVPAMLATILAGAVFLINYNRNYAAEVAAPIEEELVKAGAVKRCSSGSTGREFGGSNLEPYYGATFGIQIDEQNAAELVKGIAKKYGYLLVQGSPDYHGDFFRVDDSIIRHWYYDTVRPNSGYTELKEGVVNLVFVVNAPGSAKDCGDDDPFRSFITVSTKLPEQKWRLY